jgi:hypothetical protein
MIISGLDFGLIITISYLLGLGSGIGFVCKYKDNFMIRSRSRDNLSSLNHHNQTQVPQIATPVLPSAPPPHAVAKITLE